MLTLRRRSPREDVSLLSAGGRPILLATLDVPFAEDATAFAVDSAVENGQPLVVVNAAEVLPAPWALLGYGYIEREDLQAELRKPAELAHSLAVKVERLRVCSPHPIDALLELVAERKPGVLVFGPERSRLKPRTYRRAATKIRKRVTCLVWFAEMD
jgi:Universal stress protein family